jgi:hypothetical protein
MNPYESLDNLAQDPRGHVNSRFLETPANGRFADLSSEPVQSAGVTTNMPSLWTSQMPVRNGGWAPMADAMKHMLMVNSFTRESDGHQADSQQLERPLGSQVSIAGAVADRSRRSVPAAAMGESPRELFRANSTGLVYAEGYTGNLAGILSPFNRPSGEIQPGFLSRREAMDRAVASVMSTLGTWAGSNQPGADALWSVAGRAEAQVRQGVGDLVDEYATLLAKYRDIMVRSADYLTHPLSGITDRAVPYSAFPKDSRGNCWLTLTMEDGPAYLRNADLRTMLTPSSYVGGLAETFAVVEYLLTHGFSSSIISATPGVYGLNFENCLKWGTSSAPATLGTISSHWYNDSHGGSPMIDLIAFGFMYRAIFACVHELIQVLKESTVSPWEQTVIQVAGEFSRSSGDPYQVKDADGVVRYHGTGHGWTGACTTLFSGMIKRPWVLGNPLRSDAYGEYPGSGTWGTAGSSIIGGVRRRLVYGNVCSTIAEMLEIENPTPNDKSLVTKNSDGSVVPISELGTAKIVDT